MCSLDLNIHQRILSEIAISGDAGGDPSFAHEIIGSKVQTTRNLGEDITASETDGGDEPIQRVFMVWH